MGRFRDWAWSFRYIGFEIWSNGFNLGGFGVRVADLVRDFRVGVS